MMMRRRRRRMIMRMKIGSEEVVLNLHNRTSHFFDWHASTKVANLRA